MKINKSKFQTAVHLGLLVIIFVLLCVNFRANLTIYHAGVAKRKALTVDLNNAALSIGRTIQKENVTAFDEDQCAELRRKHNLSGLMLISEQSSETRAGLAARLLQRARDSILTRQEIRLDAKAGSFDVRQLVRIDSREYYYMLPLYRGTKLLVVARNSSELAYLEDSSQTLIVVNIVAVLLIIVLYLLLFRVILSPFKKIRHQAVIAGRDLSEESDDVEVMVNDYRKIIDELKEKESQLLQLNQSIQAKAARLELFNEYLLRSISSGIIIFDAGGKILSVNQAAGQMMDIDPQSFVGKSCEELPSFCKTVFETVEDMLDTGDAQSYRECDMISVDGRSLSLGVTVSSIHDYTSNRVGVSVLVNDLTEIKQLRGEVETRNRLAALGEMASGLAHQLRNSIGAMAGYAHLVKKRLVESSLKTDSISALEEEAREAEKLVGKFLSFARPFDLMAEDTDVKDLIEDLIETFRVRPEYKHIKFRLNSQLPLSIPARVDTLLLKQALANILENAINAYDGKTGYVELGLSSHSGLVAISVQDFGCGIAEEDIEKIFTPFYSSRPSGTGLGLPLAKKIVDLHQGRLTVSSEPGKGTLFTVFLPSDSSPAASPRTDKVEREA